MLPVEGRATHPAILFPFTVAVTFPTTAVVVIVISTFLPLGRMELPPEIEMLVVVGWGGW
jgi:hypothetical protein